MGIPAAIGAGHLITNQLFRGKAVGSVELSGATLMLGWPAL